MKLASEIIEGLNARGDFRIAGTGADGGMGVFTSGAMKGMSVVWSCGDGWEHVSMDGVYRMPTWDEMCELKAMFWRDDETCVEYHPAKDRYVNNIPYCLHIWRPIEKYSGKMPVPPELLVGLPGVEFARRGK